MLVNHFTEVYNYDTACNLRSCGDLTKRIIEATSHGTGIVQTGYSLDNCR
jgi:hypothetical protein